MKIRLTSAAIRDLRRIRTYIGFDSPRAAARIAAGINKVIGLMGERPETARPRANGVREWSVPGLPYVIPHRVAEDAVEIIHIWHTSRKRPEEW